MRYKYILAAALASYHMAATAGVGSVDERIYVNWDEYPYNQIVSFEPKTFACTAQYVARDIILTARHCITYKKTFDNYEQIGKQFEIKLHDGRKTHVTLEKYGYDQESGDWALLRVTDSNFFSSNFFDLSAEDKTLNVTNAGFGYLRIISDDEIKKLKKIFEQTAKEHKMSQSNHADLIAQAQQAINAAGIPNLVDLTDEARLCFVANQPGTVCDMNVRLKAHIGCKLTKTNKKNSTISNTCDAMQGNSGGPYFSGNTIYGICSRGYDTFKDSKNGAATAVAPSQIWKNLRQMSPTQSTPQSDTATAQSVDQSQLDQRKSELNKKAENISNASDKEFLHFLDDMTDYQVLEERYERAKRREQSTANKILGAAAIGLTGAGMRNWMQGSAESALDENAESAMKAYLQTFRCNWGAGGTSYKGGAANIELPGAGALMPLVTEYKALAAELKETKAALGMAPGIESEEVLDNAAMGLHDNDRHGIETGAFTSVSRALLDNDGEDANHWADQKSSAKKKSTTGAIMTGVGVVGGTIGNLVINKDNDDDKFDGDKK